MALLTDLLAPVGAAGRAALQSVMVGLLAGLLALTGGTLLLAGACVSLVPLVGVAGALSITGLAFILLAGGTILIGLTRRSPVVLPPVQRPQPDPLVQLIFDLSFNLGRSLPRRRD